MLTAGARARARTLRGHALTEARRVDAIAAAEGVREVSRLAIADQARHVGDRDRALLGQQLGRGRQPSRAQILGKGQLAKLLIRALHLPGGELESACATSSSVSARA